MITQAIMITITALILIMIILITILRRRRRRVMLLQAFTKAVDSRFFPNINGNAVPK